eukprot:14377236-Ditylum_brightwellii.AAC.1
MLDLLINSQSASQVLKSEVLADQHDTRSLPNSKNERRVMKLQRYERIPAWPVSNGLKLKVIELLPGGHRVASDLEERYGGMDCPNTFVNTDEIRYTSPFLLLVHHNHMFRLNDPTRWIEKSLIPEGFPSHAHRGMLTVTICLNGGMVHRDSLGIKQAFGVNKIEYSGKHTQALNFGAGVIHELMWDNTPSRRGQQVINQEIYQIWVDLPTDQRMSNISVDLLGGKEETPTVVEKRGSRLKSSTLVIAGSHRNHKSTMAQKSAYTILLVTVEPGEVWRQSSPTSYHSMILYMRKGSGTIGGRRVPKHYTAFCSTDGDIEVVAGSQGADFLYLAGGPLDQNVVARGSMVGESGQDITDAMKDVNQNKMGKPWEVGISDAEWRRHIRFHPCSYNAEE